MFCTICRLQCDHPLPLIHTRYYSAASALKSAFSPSAATAEEPTYPTTASSEASTAAGGASTEASEDVTVGETPKADPKDN